MKSTKIIKNLQHLERILFFITILFLPTQLGKHFWPDFAFIYSLRIDYLSPVIYFWDLLLVSLFVVFGSLVYLNKNKVNKKFLILFLLFILSQAFSAFNAVNPEASLVRLKGYLFAGFLGVFISSKPFTEIKKYLLGALLISVFFICFLAISQFLLGRSLGLWVLGERSFSLTTPLIARFNFYENIFLRPYATFSHPNLLSAFLILSLPIVIYNIPKKLEAFRLTSSLLILSTIFITFSRPGLILALLQTTILFKRFWKLLLIIGIIITPLVAVRIISVFTFDTLAVLRRQELSDYAVRILLEHSLFGVGLNNFINVLAQDRVLVGTSRFLQPVHNIFLLILAETGIIGMFGLLGILGSAIWQNLKKSDTLSKVLLGNLFMIVFLGLFDHYFLTLPQGQRLLFMILGLSFCKR